MTRILVQRGSSSSSSKQNRSSLPSSSNTSPPQLPPNHPPQINPAVRNEDDAEEVLEQVVVSELPEHTVNLECKISKTDSYSLEGVTVSESGSVGNADSLLTGNEDIGQSDLSVGLLKTSKPPVHEDEQWCVHGPTSAGTSPPPPPPVPPPRPFMSIISSSRRPASGTSISPHIRPSRRPAGWPISSRTSPSGSSPSSPRSLGEAEEYNSADEQNPCLGSFYDDLERERDHFSQFVTEGFTSYCKRKRRDKYRDTVIYSEYIFLFRICVTCLRSRSHCHDTGDVLICLAFSL